MIKRVIFILGILLLAVLQGCSGSLKGVIRQDAKRVQFTYTDSRIWKGNLQTVLPGGESFEGRLVKIGSTETESDTTVADSGAASFEDVQLFDGDAEATLLGNKGNIMKCRFKLADIIIGLSSGGFGICQVSDGQVIDVFF